MVDFTFYFGAASGSARKALKKLEEPNVMLNYATKNNQPWDAERLFIDSGGYSFMRGQGEYATSNEEYLDYVEDAEPELFALRDYPCGPDVLDGLGRTVKEHQDLTIEKHSELLNLIENRSLSSQPVSIVQGWGKQDYLEHLDRLTDRGLLTDYMGVGSLVRRNREAELREIILAVRDALPQKYDLHAFGVKGSVLKFADVRKALDSSDSQSYEMKAQWSTLTEIGDGRKTWRDSAYEYLKQKRRLRAILAGDDVQEDTIQQTLGEV